MATTPQTTGSRLKQLRESRGWTRQDVYDRIRDEYGDGLPASTLEKWESDISEPRASLAARLTRLYEVSLDYVFLLADEPSGRRSMHQV